jgi:hypothetical protein
MKKSCFFFLQCHYLQDVFPMLRAGNYFGLDCGLLGFFKYSTHEPSSKDQLLTFPHFFGDRIVGKDGGLCTHNPSAEEVGGLEVFFVLIGLEL